MPWNVPFCSAYLHFEETRRLETVQLAVTQGGFAKQNENVYVISWDYHFLNRDKQ